MTTQTQTGTSVLKVPVPSDPRPRAAGLTVGGDERRWQDSVRAFYDHQAANGLSPRTRHYHRLIEARLAKLVEPGSRVLEIGCGNGDLLACLRPSVGVGVDLSGHMVQAARRLHPKYRFLAMRGEDVHQLNDTFDYVVISQTLGEIYDLQKLLRSVLCVCHARTRLVIVHDSRLWQPALKLMEWLRIKKKSPERNWTPSEEVENLLQLSGFSPIRTFDMTLLPVYVPVLSGLLNRFVANLPGFHHLALNYVLIARPTPSAASPPQRASSVSIVIPARNEAGHIKQLVKRIPSMADRQEIILVEGNSTDDTWEVMREVSRTYSGPFDIKCLRQDGTGKGDAVRKGFAAATGDVLMILDADISVPPEELPSFFEALLSGKGEFINGSRMVYLMDTKAMRFLNLLGNKLFGCVFTYLLSQRFRDTLCGTKVLTRRDYERIAANRAYFGEFDPFGDFDLLFGAARLNLKIVDMPVHYKARSYGDTNISRWTHGWMLLRMCFFAARKIKFV